MPKELGSSMEEEKIIVSPEWRKRLENDAYKNWLKVGYAINLACNGIRPYIERQAKAFHGILIAKGMASCACVHVPSRRHNPHHDMAVCVWSKELERHHTKRKPTWNQSDGSKWTDPTTGYWEVAKLYMPFGCASGKASPGETDATGLLNLLHHCDHFKTNSLLIERLKSSRNKWAHEPKQELTQREMDDAFITIKDFLQDPELFTDPDAKESLENVIALETKSLIEFADIEDIEQNVKNHLKEFMERIVDKLDSLKDQVEVHSKDIIDEITQVKKILNYCSVVDQERDNVLVDIQSKIRDIHSHFTDIQSTSLELNKPKNTNVATACCIYIVVQLLRLFFIVTRFFDSIRRYMTLFLLFSGVTLLQKNVEDLGCLPNHFDLHELKQFDFTDNLNSAKEGFIGRQWMFSSLTDSLQNHSNSKGVLLVADPGFGKSALISSLICSRLSSYSINTQILGFHLCIHSDRDTQNAGKFVQNLVNMIASRIQEYADLISKDQFLQRTLKYNCFNGPSRCFDQGIIAPLNKLLDSEQLLRPMYIVIDALDECDNQNHIDNGASIVDVLNSKMRRFPNWLKVIATTRNVTNIRRKLRSLNQMDLLPDDERNMKDIESFLRMKFLNSFNNQDENYSIRDDHDSAILNLVNKSQGNFLYIKLVTEHIENNGYDKTKWNSLPTSIDSVYQNFFERKFHSVEKFRAVRKLCEVLVASLSPLTVNELYSVLSADDKEFHYEYDFMTTLEDLSMYLRYFTEKEYVSFFHLSLREWLVSKTNRGGQFFVDQKEGNRLLANYFINQVKENVRVNPQFVHHLATYIVKGGNLKHLLESFLEIDAKVLKVADRHRNVTALHLASGSGNNETLKLLLNIFEEVDLKDHRGQTPAFYAVKFDQIYNLRMLHSEGASLHSVTDNCSREMFGVNWKNQINDFKRQMCSYSFLHVASQLGHNEIAQYLLENNVSISFRSETDDMAIHLATEFGHFQIMKSLAKDGSYLDSKCLRHAVSNKRFTIVKFLLENEVKDNCIDCNRISEFKRHLFCNTALHIAVIKNLPRILSMLLQSNYNAMNCFNVHGRNPLHEAVQYNNYRLVKTLLQSGAHSSSICTGLSPANFPLNEESSFCPCGYTSLHIAAHYGFSDVTKLLLQHKAYHNVTDCYDFLPIHIASCRGHGEVLSILVENGVDVNSKNSQGMTATHYACKCQAEHLFDVLVNLGADGFVRTADGKMPLDFLVENQFIDQNFTFIDPYVDIPVEPIDYISIYKEKYSVEMHGYHWITLWTKFLVVFSKSSQIDLDKISNLSKIPFMLKEVVSQNLSKTLFGSNEFNFGLMVFAMPLTYTQDVGFTSCYLREYTENGKIKEIILKVIPLSDKITSCSLLVESITFNTIYLLDFQLAMGYNINCIDKSGLSPILAYLRQGGRNIAKVLVKHGVTIDIKCGEGFWDSEFHLAAYHKFHYLQYLSVYEYPSQWEDYLKTNDALFDYLFDEYEKTTHGGQVRITRARDGPVTKAIKSHSRGFKIIDECLDFKGYTPLHRAAQGGNVVAVKHFLNWGANVSVASPEGFDLLTLNIWYAVKYRPRLNFHKYSLLTALETDFASFSATVILDHLTKEKSFNIGCNSTKETPTLLHLAATRGMWRFIRDLFTAKDNSKVIGLDANCPTKHGITPMYLAKVYGGEDCEWDNPWCKVVGVLLQNGASEILPERITEYFVILNFLFHDIPKTLDLELSKKEMAFLRNSSLGHECLSEEDQAIPEDNVQYSQFIAPLNEAEDQHIALYNAFAQFLNKEIKILEAGFEKFKSTEDSILQCVSNKVQKHPELTDQSESASIIKSFEEILESIKLNSLYTRSFEGGYTIENIPFNFYDQVIDLCSMKVAAHINKVEETLQHNRRSLKASCRNYRKEMERIRRAYNKYISRYKPIKQLLKFGDYEKEHNCGIRNASYLYIRLKYLSHTVRFLNEQVQRILIYRSISKFVSQRIQETFLSDNKEQMIGFILELARYEPWRSHQYLEMLRFTKPPMFYKTMMDDE